MDDLKILKEEARNYKRRIAGAFVPISPGEITSKISGNKIYVSRKIDGEFNIFYFNGERAYLINANGVVKENLPILKEAENIFKLKKIKTIKLAVELHVKEDNKRTRITDVFSALANDVEKLTISPFDILSIDGEDFPRDDYKKIIDTLVDIFNEDNAIKPVSLEVVTSKEEVAELFNKIVVEDQAEGLVVRSLGSPIVYKIKPLYTFDVVVIGFSESEEKKVAELLLAVQKQDGDFVQIGRSAVGFSDSQRIELYNLLSKSVVKSTYVETDIRNVAFRMVKPEIVIEISVNELITETSKGIVKNKLLSYSDEEGYKFKANIAGVSLPHPVFIRIRNDKKVNIHDVRHSQLTDIVYIEESETKILSKEDYPKSEILLREVYTKQAKDNLSIQKFMVLKTNKEKLDQKYPAYVFCYTDFSPKRKDPLSREVKISNSKEQIMEIAKNYIDENVKKGWNKIC